MDAIFRKTVTILPSQVDSEGKLSVAETFDLFMDTATEAAGALGVGWDFLLKKGLFWLTVKTRVQFLDRPRLLDRVEVVTWPERPGEKRCNRHYEIRRAGETLVKGKTEWAIVSVAGCAPQPLAGILPAALDYPEARACPEPFPMIDESFPEPPFARHVVNATDIDMARHMNNVAYVRAIVNAFSLREWRALDVRQVDIVFRVPAHEGDTLQFQQRREGRTLDIRGSLPGGGTIVLARMATGAPEQQG